MIEMGMHANADVVYGVDLGDAEYAESYVEYPEDWDDDLTQRIDDLADEYLGWTEKYDGTSEWFKRRREYMEGKAALGVDSYGYEWSGKVISSARAGGAEYSAEPINLGETHHDELEGFLRFLESRGLKFTNPEKRKPGWLVLASYG